MNNITMVAFGCPAFKYYYTGLSSKCRYTCATPVTPHRIHHINTIKSKNTFKKDNEPKNAALHPKKNDWFIICIDLQYIAQNQSNWKITQKLWLYFYCKVESLWFDRILIILLFLSWIPSIVLQLAVLIWILAVWINTLIAIMPFYLHLTAM